MAKLFFVGDSITVGAWDKKGGWANRLIGRIMEETMKADFSEGAFYCMPYNLSGSGDTVPDLLRRLRSEVRARLDQDTETEAVQIILSIGVNDSVYLADEQKPSFTDEEFRENLESLIELSRSLAQQLAFIGLLPVDDDLLNPTSWATGKRYTCQHVRRFEGIIESVCAVHSLPFLPLFERWQNMQYKHYLFDGLHPNSNGHALLADQIGEFIITEKFKNFHSSQ